MGKVFGGIAVTNAELKQALFSAAPVRYNGIEYQRVCEIVYRRPANEVIVSAGLMDKNGSCIVYARPEKVSAVDGS
jgi:hypothetical protein